MLSIRHTFDAWGIPYRVMKDVTRAAGAPEMIVVAGALSALGDEARSEIDSTLERWLLSEPARSLWLFADGDSQLLARAGARLASIATSRAHILVDPGQDLAKYLDTEEEQDVYVPSLDDGTRFVTTIGYDLSQLSLPWHARVVGRYEDGAPGIVVLYNQETGSRLVLAGFAVEDFLFRMQYEKSALHIRGAQNVFEPCADTIRLLIRASYEQWTRSPFLRPFAPNGRQAVVLLSHDVDANAGYAPLRDQFILLERFLGLRSTLFVTTSYRDNGYLSDMFTSQEHQQILRGALAEGWDIQSHSVSHMPDMGAWLAGELETNPTRSLDLPVHRWRCRQSRCRRHCPARSARRRRTRPSQQGSLHPNQAWSVRHAEELHVFIINATPVNQRPVVVTRRAQRTDACILSSLPSWGSQPNPRIVMGVTPAKGSRLRTDRQASAANRA